MLCCADDDGCDDPAVNTIGSLVTAPQVTVGATHPLTSVPALNSDPAATDQIYLDFTGAAAMSWGAYSVPATPAFTQDADPTTFSDGELAAIQEIWSRVSEKFSPFNINVTTVDPGVYNHKQTLRVVIGGDGAWLGGGAGGTAYVGGFASSFLPNTVFTFSSAVGNDPHNVAEDAAHESGHAFGLNHQSTYSGTTKTAEYNPGDANTAPIMGVSYSAARGLWWDGTSSVSSTTIQDDLAVISNATNGFGYRPQDHGQTAAAADALAVSGSSLSGAGVIAQTSDQDYFTFTTTAAGSVTLSVSPAQYGAMLHAKLELRDASNNLIATAADAASLGQSINTTLAAGKYYLVVKSFGSYGDLGQYSVTGTVPTGVVAPTFTLSGAGSVNERATYTLSLSAVDAGHTVSSWAINWGDGSGVQNVTGNPSSVTHTFAVGPNNYTISATATDDVGTYSASTQAVTVNHVAPTRSISGAASVNEGSVYTLSLSSSDVGHTISGWAINWGDGSAVQNVSGNPASVTHTFAVGPNSYTVSATITDDVGTYSANTQAVTVNHVAPVLSISGASSVAEGILYTLSLSASDAGHTVSGWAISWGDGSAVQNVTGNPSSVTHTFAIGPNNYTVSATATDDVGTYSANTQAVAVNHVAPTRSISGTASVNEGSVYTLSLSSSDVGHTISGWAINWGDGSAVQNVSGNPASVTHTFALGPNNYTISATITDDVGTYSANTKAVTVTHVPPTVTISGAASVNEGVAYTLSLSAPDGGHTISGWVIHWGDGSAAQSVTGNPASVTHTFAKGPNSYTITASATDDVGTYASNSQAVSVTHVPPTLSISGPGSISEGSLYTLNLSATDPGHTISGWSINWGDGTSAQSVTGSPASVTHSFALHGGSYTISATATDDVSTYSANTQATSVTFVAPTPTISGASSVTVNATYTLQLAVSSSGPNNVSGWSIDWGDGVVQSLSGNPTSVTHMYAAANSYTIAATVTNQDGTFSSNSLGVTAQAIVLPPAPVANAGGPYTVAEGGTVVLDGTGSTGTGLTYTWDLNGDGITGETGSAATRGNETGSAPTFSAAGLDGPGTYTVTLVVTDSSGQSDTTTATINITDVAPTLTLSGANQIGEGATYTLNLAATDPGPDPISGWTVNWGDGNVQSITGNPSSVTHVFSTAQSFTIAGTATNSDGTFDSNSVSVTVAPHAPTAVANATNITAASTAAKTFTVTYSSEVGINVGTLGAGNVTVVDPHGNVLAATLVGVDTNSNGSPRTATYSIAAPAGGWTWTQNGTYQIKVAASQVADTTGQFVAAGAVGSFAVSIAAPVSGDTTPPTAQLSATNITANMRGVYTFYVTYSDNVAVYVGSLSSTNLLVTGPNGYSQYAQLVTVNRYRSGTPRTATYTVTSGGRYWLSPSDGTYSVALRPFSVADVNGNYAVAKTLGTFSVQIPGAARVGRAAPVMASFSAVPITSSLGAAISGDVAGGAWSVLDLLKSRQAA